MFQPSIDGPPPHGAVAGALLTLDVLAFAALMAVSLTLAARRLQP